MATDGLRPFPAVRCADGGHALSAHRRSRLSPTPPTVVARRPVGTRARNRTPTDAGGVTSTRVVLSHALARRHGARGSTPRTTSPGRQRAWSRTTKLSNARHAGAVVRLGRFADKCANDARRGAARHPAVSGGTTRFRARVSAPSRRRSVPLAKPSAAVSIRMRWNKSAAFKTEKAAA